MILRKLGAVQTAPSIAVFLDKPELFWTNSATSGAAICAFASDELGPNFSVVLRLRGGAVAEAARPVSYMKGWELARVLALAERWGWKAEMSGAAEAQVAQVTQAPQSPRPAP